jgi:hypothetical protein
MSRYDGLIIPRSYNEYINKTDPIAMSQALQLNGVMDDAPTENSNHPVKSGGLYTNYARVTEGSYCDQATSINDGLIQSIVTSFNSATNYSTFSGYSQNGMEGYWRGYRHAGTGEVLIITKNRILILILGSGGTIIKLRTIIRL